MMAPGPVLAELSCRDFLCVFITAVPCTKLFGVFKNTWNTFFLKKSLQPLAKTYFTKTLQSSADSSNNMAPSSSPPRRASPGARESRFCSSFRRVTMRAGHGLAARVRSASLAPVAIASRHLACRLQGFPPVIASRAVLVTAEEHRSAWLQRAHARVCLRAVGAAPTSLPRARWRVGTQGCAQPRGNPFPAVTSLQCHAQPCPCPCHPCGRGRTRMNGS
jgi:hypothetical protein